MIITVEIHEVRKKKNCMLLCVSTTTWCMVIYTWGQETNLLGSVIFMCNYFV